MALLTFIAALLVLLSGGLRFHIGSLVVSSRDVARPAGAAVLFYLLSLVIAPRSNRGAAWEWLREVAGRTAPLIAVVAAGAVFWLGVAYGARAASGSDTFGYVSQAYLWLKGDLYIQQPLAAEAPWPYAEESLSPLAYRPGAERWTIVPVYPSGLPLIMAAFHLLFGIDGPYYVAPIFAALLVALTFWLALRLTQDRLTSALAAIFMAASPAFLFNLMVPMSDIVAAALWVLVLLLVTWPRLSHAAAAGCVAGLATLVRPNLAPLAVAGMLAAELWRGESRRGVRALAVAAGVGLAAIAVLLLNNHLHGSPLMSGYGAPSTLYALDYFAENVRRYASWLLESQSPVVFVAAAPLIFRQVRPAWLTRRQGAPAAAFVAILAASYLFYLPFPDWWYLRFVLAAFPFLFMLIAAPLAWLARRMPAPIGLPGLVVAVALLIAYWGGFVLERRLLDVGYGEQRYAAVGQFIDRELPENAVIMSYQHSGTIRYYSGRMTLHYKLFSPGRLPTVIQWLDANGYRPYLLLEDWEEKDYLRRFAEQGALGRLELPVIAEAIEPVTLRLYDPLGTPAAVQIPLALVVPRERRSLGPRGPWQQ